MGFKSIPHAAAVCAALLAGAAGAAGAGTGDPLEPINRNVSFHATRTARCTWTG